MIDKENYLFGQAKANAASGDFAAARGVYQQVADLHGDREQEAIDAVQKMNGDLKAATVKTEAAQHQYPPVPVHTKAAPQPAKNAPVSETRSTTPAPAPSKPLANCQLIPTDIPRYLDMADNNRGRGKYSDAEREYNSVLQCDPENGRARTGLNRTKQAEAIPSSSSAP
jgi:tetratricopeptide (TPR) repeat protein